MAKIWQIKSISWRALYLDYIGASFAFAHFAHAGKAHTPGKSAHCRSRFRLLCVQWVCFFSAHDSSWIKKDPYHLESMIYWISHISDACVLSQITNTSYKKRVYLIDIFAKIGFDVPINSRIFFGKGKFRYGIILSRYQMSLLKPICIVFYKPVGNNCVYFFLIVNVQKTDLCPYRNKMLVQDCKYTQ